MKHPIILSVKKISEDKCEISIDDLQRKSEKSWDYHTNVSSEEYPIDKLVNLEFEENELADFGHYVLARLRGNFIVEEKIDDPLK